MDIKPFFVLMVLTLCLAKKTQCTTYEGQDEDQCEDQYGESPTYKEINIYEYFDGVAKEILEIKQRQLKLSSTRESSVTRTKSASYAVAGAVKRLFDPVLSNRVVQAASDKEATDELMYGTAPLAVLVFVHDMAPVDRMLIHINHLAATYWGSTKIIVLVTKRCQQYAGDYGITAATPSPTYVFRARTTRKEICRYVGRDNGPADCEFLTRKINELMRYRKVLVASDETDIRKKLRHYVDKVMVLYFDAHCAGCTHCSDVMTELEQLAFSNRYVVFVRVDVALCPETAAEFLGDAKSFPAFAVFENVTAVDRQIDLVWKCDTDEVARRVEEAKTRSYANFLHTIRHIVRVASDDTDLRGKLRSNDAGGLVVLYFNTDCTCSLCRTDVSELQMLALNNRTVLFMQVDINKCKETAREYNVTDKNLPVFAIFFNVDEGKEIHRVEGRDVQAVERTIKKLLNIPEVAPVDPISVTRNIPTEKLKMKIKV